MSGAAAGAAVSEPLARFLRSHRDELNQRFALAKRRWPALEGAAFASFLRETAAPLVGVGAAADAPRADELARAAYEIGLELVAQQLAGPQARHAWIERLWRTTLPRLARLVAQSPERVLASLSNALHQLATTSGARPQGFLADLERLAEHCAEAGQLLAAGQVCGWRAGLPHYRTSALEVADTLPEALACLAVAAPPGAQWSDLRGRFRADPFFDPSEARGSVKVEVAARVGAFRGLGGTFTVPPLVAAEGDHLWVTSGGESFLLCADRYGATLHRGTPEARRASERPPGVVIEGRHVSVRGVTLDLGSAGVITSAAVANRTLALTTARSHAVSLVRLGPATA